MCHSSYNLCNEFGQIYSGGPIIFVPNSKKIIFPTQKSISIIDLVIGKIEPLNFRFRSTITTIDIDKTGKYLAIVDTSNLISIIDLDKKIIKGKLLIKGRCFLCKWSPRGKYLALAIHQNVQVWKTDFSENGARNFFQLSMTYFGHHKNVCSLAWNFCGDFIVSAEKAGMIKIFPFRKKYQFRQIDITRLAGKIKNLQFFDFSTSFLVFCTDNKLFKIGWIERKTKKTKLIHFTKVSICKLKIAVQQIVATSFFLHEASSRCSLGFSDGSVRIYELKKLQKEKKFYETFFSLKTIQKILFSRYFVTYVSTLSICPNFRYIVVANDKRGTVIIFDHEKKKIIAIHENFFESPSCLASSFNDNLVIVGNKKGKISIWSTKSGFCIIKFSNHLSVIKKVIFFNFSSRLAASSSKDGSIKIYDLKNCAVIRTLTSTTKAKDFDNIAINYSGFFIASSCQKSFRIFVWSVRTGNLIEKLEGHQSFVSSLFFPKKTFEIFSSSFDCTFRLWQFDNKNKKHYQFSSEIFRSDNKIFASTVHPHLSEIALLIENNQIVFFDLNGKKSLQKIRNKFVNRNQQTFGTIFDMNASIVYSFDGTKLFYLSETGLLYFRVHQSLLTEDYTKCLTKRHMFQQIDILVKNAFPMKKDSGQNYSTRKIIQFVNSKKKDLLYVLQSSLLIFSVQKINNVNKVYFDFKNVTSNNDLLAQDTLKWFIQKIKQIKKMKFSFIFYNFTMVYSKIVRENNNSKVFLNYCDNLPDFRQPTFFILFSVIYFRFEFFSMDKVISAKKIDLDNKYHKIKNRILKKMKFIKFLLFTVN